MQLSYAPALDLLASMSLLAPKLEMQGVEKRRQEGEHELNPLRSRAAPPTEPTGIELLLQHLQANLESAEAEYGWSDAPRKNMVEKPRGRPPRNKPKVSVGGYPPTSLPQAGAKARVFELVIQAATRSLKCLHELEKLLKTDAKLLEVRGKYNRTPLMAAIDGKRCMVADSERRREVVKVLLDHGADINASDGDWRVLHLAVGRQQLEALKEMLRRGVDTRIVTVAEGDTAVHVLLKETFNWESPVKLEMLELLLATEFDLGAQNRDGNTILHLAGMLNAPRDMYIRMVEAMKNGGVLKDVLCRRSAAGDTPLLALMGHRDLGRCRGGGDEGEDGLLDLLLANGAGLYERDGKGRSVLHRAVLRMEAGLVQSLLEKDTEGRLVLMADDSGTTPEEMVLGIADPFQSRKRLAVLECFKKSRNAMPNANSKVGKRKLQHEKVPPPKARERSVRRSRTENTCEITTSVLLCPPRWTRRQERTETSVQPQADEVCLISHGAGSVSLAGLFWKASSLLHS